MSFLPAEFNGKASINLRDLAVYDLPMPDVADRTTSHQWNLYLSAIPLARKISKFGEGIDALIAFSSPLYDFKPADADKLHAKFELTYVADAALNPAFKTRSRDVREDKFDSDFAITLHWITQFMQDIKSPEAAVWEKRRDAFEAQMPVFKQRYRYKPDAHNNAPQP